MDLYGQRLEQGQKVRFNGRTNILNDKVYTGLIGTVDFQCSSSSGNEHLVYVFIRKEGQRKDRCIGFHREALEVVAQ